METVYVFLLIALVFGICWLVDKAFTRIFRNQAQHHSGKAVRLNKHYCTMGLVLVVLGIGSVISSSSETLLLAGGGLILLVGIVLLVYYLSTGIFYDNDSFLFTAFGKKNRTYRYGDILQQRLYLVQGGQYIVELHMNDGNTVVHVQTQMEGCREFLRHAHNQWCQQKGLDPETSPANFDPDAFVYFPNQEEN